MPIIIMDTQIQYIYVQPHREDRFIYQVNFGRTHYADRTTIQLFLIENSKNASKEIIDALNSLIIFILDVQSNKIMKVSPDNSKVLEKLKKEMHQIHKKEEDREISFSESDAQITKVFKEVLESTS